MAKTRTEVACDGHVTEVVGTEVADSAGCLVEAGQQLPIENTA